MYLLFIHILNSHIIQNGDPFQQHQQQQQRLNGLLITQQTDKQTPPCPRAQPGVHHPLWNAACSPLFHFNHRFTGTRLVVLLDASGGHAVNDGVPTRVHVSDGQADGQQGEEHDNTEPQDDVEDDWVGLFVLLGEVDVVLEGEKL